MNSIVNLTIEILAAAIVTLILRFLWSRFTLVVHVPAHHCCIHHRNGKLVGLLEPGRFRFFGTGHQIEQFDMRLQQLTLQTQELTTSEGITVKITAVGNYRILDPLVATTATADFNATLYTVIQLALRDAVNGLDADALLSSVRAIGNQLIETVRNKAANLGLEVTELVVRDLILPAEIKTALSEAWRSKKSALGEIEVARGKAAVTRSMANVARLYEINPVLLKVRYLEAIEQAAKGVGNTIVIGMADDKNLKLI